MADETDDTSATDAGAAPEAVEPAVREPNLPRHSRRVSDKILISFHQACDQNDFDVAQQLLNVFEFILTRREMPADINRRRSQDSLVAAHERLWHLRHPERR